MSVKQTFLSVRNMLRSVNQTEMSGLQAHRKTDIPVCSRHTAQRKRKKG